jgi:hypothetical protein
MSQIQSLWIQQINKIKLNLNLLQLWKMQHIKIDQNQSNMLNKIYFHILTIALDAS